MLFGLPESSVSMRMFERLCTAYEKETHSAWQAVMKKDCLGLYHPEQLMDELPFPRWWEETIITEFNLSSWVAADLVKSVSLSAHSAESGGLTK